MAIMAKLKYLTGAIFTLKTTVLYPIDSNNSKFKRSLYKLWAILFILTFVTGFIQCFVFLCVNPFDLVEEAMIVMSFVFYSTTFLYFIVFYKNWPNMQALVRNINKNFQDITNNRIERISMKKSSQLSDNIAYFWTSSIAVGSVIPILLTLSTGNFDMPIPAWFPYDYNRSPIYEITYLWQVFCLITLAIIYGASDMIYPCVTILIGKQFKILASNFKNNFFTSLMNLGVDETVVRNFRKDLKSQKFQEFSEKYKSILEIIKQKKFRVTNLYYMKRNIKHHQLLLGYCDDVNKIFNIFLLIRISAIVFNLIFIGFNVVVSTDRTMMLGFCNYFCFGSTELFIHTYSGQILTENADFLWTLYESPWYFCDITFQKMLILVQMRVQRLVHTKAGNFFPIVAASFIAFQRAVFSYITLLKEVTELGKA